MEKIKIVFEDFIEDMTIKEFGNIYNLNLSVRSYNLLKRNNVLNIDVFKYCNIDNLKFITSKTKKELQEKQEYINTRKN